MQNAVQDRPKIRRSTRRSEWLYQHTQSAKLATCLGFERYCSVMLLNAVYDTSPSMQWCNKRTSTIRIAPTSALYKGLARPFQKKTGDGGPKRQITLRSKRKHEEHEAPCSVEIYINPQMKMQRNWAVRKVVSAKETRNGTKNCRPKTKFPLAVSNRPFVPVVPVERKNIYVHTTPTVNLDSARSAGVEDTGFATSEKQKRMDNYFTPCVTSRFSFALPRLGQLW